MQWWYKWDTLGGTPRIVHPGSPTEPLSVIKLTCRPLFTVPSTLPHCDPTTLGGHGPLQKEQQVGGRPALPHCKWRQCERLQSTQFLLAPSTPSHVFVQKKRAVESRLILWRVCVSRVVLTSHGASAGRRSVKVVRCGKVTNVSEGVFALRSRLANSLPHTAYTVSLTNSSIVFALQMCSAMPPL